MIMGKKIHTYICSTLLLTLIILLCLTWSTRLAMAQTKEKVAVLPVAGYNLGKELAFTINTFLISEVDKLQLFELITDLDILSLVSKSEIATAQNCGPKIDCFKAIGEKLQVNRLINLMVESPDDKTDKMFEKSEKTYIIHLMVINLSQPDIKRKISRKVVGGLEEISMAINLMVGKLFFPDILGIPAENKNVSDNLSASSVVVAPFKCSTLDKKIEKELGLSIKEEIGANRKYWVIGVEDLYKRLENTGEELMRGCKDDSCLVNLARSVEIDYMVIFTVNHKLHGFEINIQLINVTAGLSVEKRLHQFWPGNLFNLKLYVKFLARYLMEKENMPKEKEHGQIKLRVTPAKARIYLDGNYLKTYQETIDNLLEGRHNIRVVANGFREFEMPFVVISPYTNLVDIKLERLPEKPWYKKWWVWTIGAAVVGGAATTAIIMAGGDGDDGGDFGTLRIQGKVP